MSRAIEPFIRVRIDTRFESLKIFNVRDASRLHAELFDLYTRQIIHISHSIYEKISVKMDSSF